MWLGTRPIFDGGGAEQYTSDLQETLERLGEIRFLNVLMSVDGAVRKEVLDHLSLEAGHEGRWNSPHWKKYQLRFPLTAALIRASAAKP